MKRRILNTTGRLKALDARLAETARIKAMVRETFHQTLPDLPNLNEEQITRVADYMARVGWTQDQMNSTFKQLVNEDRGPVPAFTCQHEFIINEVRGTQMSYTHFRDTAADPNFAIRFPGETDLILRRLTPGDLMLLASAHRLEARNPGAETNTDRNYWKAVFHDICRNMGIHPESSLLLSPHVACLICYDFAERSPDDPSYGDIHRMIMNKDSPYYSGVEFRIERRRREDADGYMQFRVFTHLEEGEESLWQTATALLIFGIDSYARARLNGNRSELGDGERHHDIFLSFLANMRGRDINFAVEIPNANQETVGDTNNGGSDTAQLQ
jgi:hypothetical protein